MALRPEACADLMTDAVHYTLDQLHDGAAARGVSCGAQANRDLPSETRWPLVSHIQSPFKRQSGPSDRPLIE